MLFASTISYRCFAFGVQRVPMNASRISVSTIIPQSVLADIKVIPIPGSPIEDKFSWGFSQDGKFTLKLAT